MIGEWIDEVKFARKAAEVAPRPPGDSPRLPTAEVKAIVTQPKGIVAILDNADPEDRKAVYRVPNLSVINHGDGPMQVTAGPEACTNACVGGGITTLNPHPAGSAWLSLQAA
jgi:hypothetical protein